MSRFQLLIREPGKAPRHFPLASPIVVGRSKSVECSIADDEVGRKQFRIGVKSGIVVLEDLGATNRTVVDNTVIESGAQTALSAGAMIRVGKTEFVIEAAEGRQSAVSPDTMDQTMIAPARPGFAQPPAPSSNKNPDTMAFRPGSSPKSDQPNKAPPADQNQPMNTMAFRPPGSAGMPPTPPSNKQPAKTKGPGQKPPAPATPPTSGDEPMNTMAFRPPGIAGLPKAPPATDKPAGNKPKGAAPAAPKPPQAASRNEGAAIDQTIDQTMVNRFRPGTAQPAGRGSLQPPQSQRSTPAPPSVTAATDTDCKSVIDETAPRLFVKGGSLKRMLSLTKPVNTVGRSEASDVLLPHESVPEQHAEIRFDGKSWWFIDSGSTNGSVVDGEHLHSNQKILRRNTLINIGALHLIFLNNSKRSTARDRREDERALQLLTQNGSIDKYTATEVLQIARADASYSVAEIVLQDTLVAVPDWAKAVVTGRRRSSLFWRILRLFTGGRT